MNLKFGKFEVCCEFGYSGFCFLGEVRNDNIGFGWCEVRNSKVRVLAFSGSLHAYLVSMWEVLLSYNDSQMSPLHLFRSNTKCRHFSVCYFFL